MLRGRNVHAQYSRTGERAHARREAHSVCARHERHQFAVVCDARSSQRVERLQHLRLRLLLGRGLARAALHQPQRDQRRVHVQLGLRHPACYELCDELLWIHVLDKVVTRASHVRALHPHRDGRASLRRLQRDRPHETRAQPSRAQAAPLPRALRGCAHGAARPRELRGVRDAQVAAQRQRERGTAARRATLAAAAARPPARRQSRRRVRRTRRSAAEHGRRQARGQRAWRCSQHKQAAPVLHTLWRPRVSGARY